MAECIKIVPILLEYFIYNYLYIYIYNCYTNVTNASSMYLCLFTIIDTTFSLTS